eukprot:4698824-Prymnesium_polylepis.1
MSRRRTGMCGWAVRKVRPVCARGSLGPPAAEARGSCHATYSLRGSTCLCLGSGSRMCGNLLMLPVRRKVGAPSGQAD